MDSVAFQFRTDFTDFGLRSRILSSMAQQCTQLAIERNIAGRSLSPSHVVKGKETEGVQEVGRDEYGTNRSCCLCEILIKSKTVGYTRGNDVI